MVLIDATENTMVQLARGFPHASKFNLEMFGYLIGLEANRLTHLVVPKYAMGVRMDRNHEMTGITSTKGRTQVLFAVGGHTGNLGILVNSSPKKIDNRFVKGNLTYIPVDLLISNRPMADYLSTDTCSKYFRGKKVGDISQSDIVQAIRKSKKNRRTHLPDDKNQWVPLEFLPELCLKIDAFVSGRRVYPLNAFISDTLVMNRFERLQSGSRQKCYGRVHVHYAYRFKEILGDALINALHSRDKKFFELMTPVDAISMLNSARAIREISDGQWDMRQAVEGVIALDPESLEIVGASYIDLDRCTAGELNTFIQLAHEAYDTREIEANLRWFEFIRPFSTPQLADVKNP